MPATGSSRNLMAGRHLTAVTITTQSIGSTGTLSTGTAYTLVDKATLVGWLESVEFETEQEIEDGAVIGSPNANDIPTLIRNTVTLTEPLRYSTTGTRNILQTAFYNTVSNGDGTTGTPYVLITVARAGKTFSFYALMKSYRESFQKGAVKGVMVCTMMDPGTGNPSIA